MKARAAAGATTTMTLGPPGPPLPLAPPPRTPPFWKLCSTSPSLFWCVILFGGSLLLLELLTINQQLSTTHYPTSSLPPPQILSTRHLNSTYPVPLGYWTAEVDHTFPAPHPSYAYSAGLLPWWTPVLRKDCFQVASAVREPYSASYRPRKGVLGPGPFPGGAPRGFYRWDEGRISRQQFDAVPHLLRGPDCLHCVDALRFKVFKGQLYLKGERHPIAAEPWHLDVAIEQLLFLLYLYPELPDVDFIVHFGDGCTNKHPVLNWNIRRDWPQAGFAYPSYSAWQMSLGLVQTHELHRCFMTRYPFASRRPHVFWRGSTTNPYFSEDPDSYRTSLNSTNMFQVPRVKLHFMSRDNQPDLDWKIFRILGHEDREFKAIKRNLPGMARKSRFEDFNANSIVLDIDGNGWSDRFVQLMRFNTPILKQASNMSAFFEHIAAPVSTVEYFSEDLSDVVMRSKMFLAEYQVNSSRLVSMAQRMQGLAAVMLTHIGLTEALGYTLQVYGSMIDWKVEMDPSYRLLSPSLCCKYTKLPREVLINMQAATQEQPV